MSSHAFIESVRFLAWSQRNRIRTLDLSPEHSERDSEGGALKVRTQVVNVCNHMHDHSRFQCAIDDIESVSVHY